MILYLHPAQPQTACIYVSSYDGEGNFGELALLYNMPRAASIQVHQPQSLQPLFHKFCPESPRFRVEPSAGGI